MSKELFALIKYAVPYHGFGKDVVSVGYISHVVGPKIGDTRKMCEYKPKDASDFMMGQLYRLKSDKDSKDGKEHPYYVYIGAMSESREELKQYMTDSSAKRIKWLTGDDHLSEAESSCTESTPVVGISAVIQEKENAKDKKNARQANANNAMLKLKSNGHFDLRAPLVEMKSNDAYKELKRLQEELKEREDATRKREELLRQKEEETRRKEELLRKKEEDLKRKDDRFETMFNTMEILKSDVERIYSKLESMSQSGSSIISGNSSTSTVSSSIVTIYGMQIKEENYKAIEGGGAVVDFCNNLLKGCFGEDAHLMRKHKGKPGTKVFSPNWFDGARAYYRDWLLKIKRRDGSALSPAEVEKMVQELGSELGKAARNMTLKGVNRVRADAIANNEDARQAVQLYQQERAAGAADTDNATPPKQRKKGRCGAH